VNNNKKTIGNAIRAVVFDNDNKVAILKVQGCGGTYYKIPGGTVEKGETDRDAFDREILEEAGCKVKIIQLLGNHAFFVEEKNKIYKSKIFLAEVIGEKSKPKFDDWEKEREFKLLWLDVQEAIEKLDSIITNDKYEIIIQNRDGDFLKKALKLRIKNET
jgi:8-oxo-dGTP diphosphatase